MANGDEERKGWGVNEIVIGMGNQAQEDTELGSFGLTIFNTDTVLNFRAYLHGRVVKLYVK